MANQNLRGSSLRDIEETLDALFPIEEPSGTGCLECQFLTDLHDRPMRCPAHHLTLIGHIKERRRVQEGKHATD